VRVEYGRGVWAENWIVPFPYIGMDHKDNRISVWWPLGDHPGMGHKQVHLPPATYHEVTVDQNQMAYSLGWVLGTDRHGYVQGIGAAKCLSEVEEWHRWNFTVLE
jgi:hypothetical protein